MQGNPKLCILCAEGSNSELLQLIPNDSVVSNLSQPAADGARIGEPGVIASPDASKTVWVSAGNPKL